MYHIWHIVIVMCSVKCVASLSITTPLSHGLIE